MGEVFPYPSPITIADRCLRQSGTRIKGKPPSAVLRTLDAEPCQPLYGISEGDGERGKNSHNPQRGCTVRNHLNAAIVAGSAEERRDVPCDCSA